MLVLNMKAVLLVVCTLMIAIVVFHSLVYLSIDAGSLSAEMPSSIKRATPR
jgi:hypothetical protein